MALTPVVHRLWTRSSAPPPSGDSGASDDEASEPPAADESAPEELTKYDEVLLTVEDAQKELADAQLEVSFIFHT